MHMPSFSLSHDLFQNVAFCMNHSQLIMMFMNLDRKDELKHVISTLSAYQVCAHIVPVAYCFDARNMPSCCFGQIVIQTCFMCMC